MHYEDLIERLRTATKLPMLQALMDEAADAIEALVGAEKRKTGKDAPLTDYISREAALESVREKVLICESLPDTIAKDASLFTLASMNDSLNSIPAADVRPVVRASLVETREPIDKHPTWHRKHLLCSECGVQIRIESWDETRCFGAGTILRENTMPNFCPNCGADMREER